MTSFAAHRRTMVDCQLRTFDVSDRAVLAAMDEIPREEFVPPGQSQMAYGDQPIALSVGDGGPRTMLAPMVLARLIQALSIRARSRILDVGCGLGYSSAVFARLGADVAALESDGALAEACRANLAKAGPGSVRLSIGPLADGLAGEAPYDAILINGAVEERPTRLLGQLADGGRLACLSNAGGAGRAVLYVRSGDAFSDRMLFDAAAPLLAAFKRPPAFQF